MILRDRVAVITGGSMGIGRAIAVAFLREGCACVLAARGQQALTKAWQELRQIGPPVETFVADISSESDVEALFHFTETTFGGLDILVNSAGIYGPIGLATEVDTVEWLRTFETNVFGVFLCCRYALRQMPGRRGRGKIINLAGGGATSPFPRFSAYAASKAAVVRLTETMAHESREKGIDINAIAPGPVNTRLLDQVLVAGAAAGDDFYRRSLKQKEEGGTSPELAAELAVLLASPRSDGLTGRLISAVWDDWKVLPSDIARIAESDLYTLRRITPSKGAI